MQHDGQTNSRWTMKRNLVCRAQRVMEDDAAATAWMLHNRPHSEAASDVKVARGTTKTHKKREREGAVEWPG